MAETVLPEIHPGQVEAKCCAKQEERAGKLALVPTLQSLPTRSPTVISVKKPKRPVVKSECKSK